MDTADTFVFIFAIVDGISLLFLTVYFVSLILYELIISRAWLTVKADTHYPYSTYGPCRMTRVCLKHPVTALLAVEAVPASVHAN